METHRTETTKMSKTSVEITTTSSKNSTKDSSQLSNTSVPYQIPDPLRALTVNGTGARNFWADLAR